MKKGLMETPTKGRRTGWRKGGPEPEEGGPECRWKELEGLSAGKGSPIGSVGLERRVDK